MRNSFFKLTLFVFQALCLSELTAIVLARPQPLGATLSRSSERSFGRRNVRSKLVEKDAVPGLDEVVLTAAATKGQTKLNQEVTLNAFDLCLCGAFATAFGDFVMHPVDTIKVTQQAATLAVDIITTAKNIFAKGGVMGFYPGVLPYMTADGLSGAIKFASFEVSKVFLEKRLPLKFHPAIQFVCAGAAMIACSFVMVPGEVIKTRMQAGMVSNMIEGITQTLKQDGIGGLFAGYYATLVRDVPYTMLELGFYENFKSVIRKVKSKEQLSQQEELAAAAVTGGVVSFLTTPLDLIKTKLMMQSTSGGGQYSGVFDALSSIYNEGGINALFVGSAARVAWLLPFTTIYLGVYEICKRRILAMKIAAKVKSLETKHKTK